MRASIIHAYGAAGVLTYTEDAPIPEPGEGQVRVKIRAASINAIDARMREGYGRGMFVPARGFEFPLILGRDLAGEIEAVGPGVNRFAEGDAVFGAPNVMQQGTYAEYLVANAEELSPMPNSIGFNEAASLAYVASTGWAALVDHAGLSAENAAGQKVLVVAGAGGVGSITVQWLKAWGCHVAATASTKNVDLLKRLGADEVIDYSTSDYTEQLRDFDVIYDNLGTDEERAMKVLKDDGTARFVTLVHPFLSTIDEKGMPDGLVAAQAEQTARQARFASLAGYHWSVARPNALATDTIGALTESGEVHPFISERFPLEQAAEAHARLDAGHVPGKLVLEIDG